MTSGVSDSVREAYLDAMAATIAADGVLDAEEIRKLYGVHALLETSDAERLNLLRRLVLEPENLGDYVLPEEILDDDELRMTLAKDALFIERTQDSSPTREAVQQLLAQIRLTPEQVNVIQDWVNWENTLLRQMGSGDEVMADASDPREIISRAAAVGVPLSVLYMAGKQKGFSASGITSGLAAIGKASGLSKLKLGWNPMTAGIAALIIAGITVKKLCDYALSMTGDDSKEMRKSIEEFRTVQLGAATRLAGDIPRLEVSLSKRSWLGRRGTLDDRSTRVLGEMHAALKAIESSAE